MVEMQKYRTDSFYCVRIEMMEGELIHGFIRSNERKKISKKI